MASVISNGDTARKVAENSEGALKAALLSALTIASDKASAARIEAYIVGGDLTGLYLYLSTIQGQSLVAAGVIQMLDAIVREAGKATEAEIDAYMMGHPGAFAPTSAYPFASQQGIVGEVLIATATPDFSFNMANPKTIQAIKTWQGQLIQEMNATMRRSVLDQVMTGLQDGSNPRETARAIKANLGLTSSQQKAVENYAKDLARFANGSVFSAQSWGLYTPKQIAELKVADPKFYRQMGFTDYEAKHGRRTAKISRATGPGSPQVYRITPDGSPLDGVTSWRLRDKRFDTKIYNVVAAREQLTAARALTPANPKAIAAAEAKLAAAQGALSPAARTDMKARYHERYLSFRAQTIARTESLRAANLGAHESFRQLAEDSDLITPDMLTKKWITAGDDRVRLDHRAVPKAAIPFNQPFIVGGVAVMYPPHGPNCRCVSSYLLDL